MYIHTYTYTYTYVQRHVPMDVQWYCPTNSHLSVASSDGISLVPVSGV